MIVFVIIFDLPTFYLGGRWNYMSALHDLSGEVTSLNLTSLIVPLTLTAVIQI